jgi:hypothetical protein
MLHEFLTPTPDREEQSASRYGCFPSALLNMMVGVPRDVLLSQWLQGPCPELKSVILSLKNNITVWDKSENKLSAVR